MKVIVRAICKKRLNFVKDNYRNWVAVIIYVHASPDIKFCMPYFKRFKD